MSRTGIAVSTPENYWFFHHPLTFFTTASFFRKASSFKVTDILRLITFNFDAEE